MKFKFWLPLTILFILIDQLTKMAASQLGWSIFLNDQFAFSLPVPPIIMYSIYFCVLVGMSWYVRSTWQSFNTTQTLAWAFVYAGGLSNIGERIVLGHVRDFIPISTGTLNVADFFILIGLVLLLVSNRVTQKSLDDKTLS
jgi:lipoprotein signal peptidase